LREGTKFTGEGSKLDSIIIDGKGPKEFILLFN